MRDNDDKRYVTRYSYAHVTGEAKTSRPTTCYAGATKKRKKKSINTNKQTKKHSGKLCVAQEESKGRLNSPGQL